MSAFSARRALAAGTDDPGTFGANGFVDRRWVTFTVAVYPTSTGSGGHQGTQLAATTDDYTIDADVTEA
jgi:hypothetical protein